MLLLPAVQVANTRNVKPKMEEKEIRLNRIGASVENLGTIRFYFLFWGCEYSLQLNIAPGPTPLIISSKDLDVMRFNYQTLYNVVERPEDVYSKKVQMRSYLPFCVFPKYSFLTHTQLQNTHRNLEHPSVEKQMKIIEQADMKYLHNDTRKIIKEIVKHFNPCQFEQGRPRRFLLSVRDPVVE